MENTIFRFRGLLGVEVQVQQSALLLLALMGGLSLMGGAGLGPVLMFLGILLASIYLHELGHAWGALVQGVPVRRIVIHGGGGFCEYQRSTNRQDELIIAMGPIVTLALWAICGLAMEGLYSLMMTSPEALPMGLAMPLFSGLAQASTLNLFLFFYNMVPVQPMDGGKLLQLGLMRLMPAGQAMRVAGAVGVVLCVLWLPGMIWLYVSFGALLLFIPSLPLHLAMMRGQFR